MEYVAPPIFAENILIGQSLIDKRIQNEIAPLKEDNRKDTLQKLDFIQKQIKIKNSSS